MEGDGGVQIVGMLILAALVVLAVLCVLVTGVVLG